MTTATRTICRADQHDFVPKKQENSSHGSSLMTTNVSEVYCRKCGTVCFLTVQEPAAVEPSRIALARPSPSN